MNRSLENNVALVTGGTYGIAKATGLGFAKAGAKGGGSIINTASIASHIGLAGAGVYVASKHAVNGLSKSAALEFAKKGIRVNTVSPGTIQTDMITRMVGEGESDAKKWWENQHPVGRFGLPEEVAAAVVWLTSPAPAFVTRP